MKKFYNEFSAYSRSMDAPWTNADFTRVSGKIREALNKTERDMPQMPAVLLKSRLHTLIAEHFEPKIFPHSPFFFEMGLKGSRNWGAGADLPGGLFDRKFREQEQSDADVAYANRGLDAFRIRIDGSLAVFRTTNRYCIDIDHHTMGYTVLMERGLHGILEDIRIKRTKSDNDFLKAAEESALAVLKIAEKFADCAETMLTDCADEEVRGNLCAIASAARRVPAEPPRSFYEGLAMLLFVRETAGTMEGVGISSLGHIDRLLGGLYQADLAAGRITEAEARRLLGLFMIPTDIRWDVEHNSWPETSTCIQLGGCDADGNPLYNDVTRLAIEVHEELHLLNPKLNCRYSLASPKEYLMQIAGCQLRGHNNFALLCDDVIFKQLKNAGASEEDARLYVNGGCQETMLEGKGHSSGANVYLLLPRLLDLSLNPASVPTDGYTTEAQAVIPEVIRNAATFEEFYSRFMANSEKLMRFFFGNMAEVGRHHRNINPCPFYSMTQDGCIENGADYTAGGAKYNFTTVNACGLATVSDSLYVIRELVYERGELTLAELAEILASDWKGAEKLRKRCIDLPKFGHNHAEADALCRRYLADLNRIVASIDNERGGKYILSQFVYYLYHTFAEHVRATPDGRKNGEFLSQGIAAGRLQRASSAVEMAASARTVDFSLQGGNAVLDLQMPVARGLTPELLSGFILGAGKSGCPTMQINIVSPEQLRDARTNPELHRDLIVRICGLSALFVELKPEVQEEIISRNMYSVS